MTQDAETVTLSVAGEEQRFTIDDEQLFEGITRATDGETSLLLQGNADAVVVATFADDPEGISTAFARLEPVMELPNGTAEATGRYAGVLVSQIQLGTEDEPPALLAIDGDVTLRADFRTNSLEGEITNRTLYLDGFPFPLTLRTDVTLTDGSISSEGGFSGVAQQFEGDELIATGRFDGVVAGTDGGTFAGTVAVGDEQGVFLAD